MKRNTAPTFVLLNARARGGRGALLWRSAEPAVRARCPDLIVRSLDTAGEWKSELDSCWQHGVRHFIAAGGDGTVGTLVNELLAGCARNGEPPVVGAVGLGSSNDYHRPMRAGDGGMPLRIAAAAAPRDVIRARWRCDDAGSNTCERYVVVSASLGLPARANLRFNAAGALVRRVRSFAPVAGIGWAALATLATHRNTTAHLTLDERGEMITLSSLTIAKTAWVSGGMHYNDDAVAVDDGTMLVALCEGMNRGALAHTLLDLSRGRFSGVDGRRLGSASRCRVTLAAADVLELDGETFAATDVEFSVVRSAIRACA